MKLYRDSSIADPSLWIRFLNWKTHLRVSWCSWSRAQWPQLCALFNHRGYCGPYAFKSCLGYYWTSDEPEYRHVYRCSWCHRLINEHIYVDRLINEKQDILE